MRLTAGGFVVAMSAGLLLASAALAKPFYIGAKKCEDCHEAEVRVWKGTKHYTRYKKFHRTAKAKQIAKAVGGGKRIKKNKVCTVCHYTLVRKKAAAKARARSGPSCESCHGPASDWLDVHNDFGGKGAKAKDESPAHKEKRLAASRKAGMIYSSMHYEIAANCMACHGLANDAVPAAMLAKLLEAKHPVKAEFELVRYSQGTVRHRFFPPDVSTNQPMSTPELARLFVVGQAAKLVSATRAAARSEDEVYRALQQQRADMARKALSAVGRLAAVKVLLASPTDANARKLSTAIRDADLSAAVAALLPAASSYK